MIRVFYLLLAIFWCAQKCYSASNYFDISPDLAIVSGDTALDIDSDGIEDYRITYTPGATWSMTISGLNASFVIAKPGNTLFAQPFFPGEKINSGLTTTASAIFADYVNPHFATKKDQYIGLKLSTGRLAWLRINCFPDSAVVLKDYAYNTTLADLRLFPPDNFVTASSLNDFDFILNEIQTSKPDTLTPLMTQAYIDRRFEFETFNHQYAIRRTSAQGNTSSFSGYIQINPSIGISLHLNSLTYSLIKTSGNTGLTTVEWVDVQGLPVSSDSILPVSGGNTIYYLKVSNLELNDVIRINESLTVARCLIGEGNEVLMRMSSFASMTLTPSEIVYENWKIVGENVRLNSSGSPYLFLNTTILNATATLLEITESRDVSHWTKTSLQISSDAPEATEPVCPSSSDANGEDYREFNFTIKKEKDDAHVLRNIELHLKIGSGNHNSSPDNMTYIPINKMRLTYYVRNVQGVIIHQEIIAVTDTIIKSITPRQIGTTGFNYGTDDFTFLVLRLPYQLSSIYQSYELYLEEYIRCPLVLEFDSKSKTSWYLGYKYNTDCYETKYQEPEYSPLGEGGYVNAFSIEPHYLNKSNRLSGPRTRDANNNGTIEINTTEYQTLPQIYNYRVSINSKEIHGPYDYSQFAVNNSSARLFVVLKMDAGLNYLAYDKLSGSTLSGAYHTLNPDNRTLFNNLHFIDRDVSSVQWNPVNSDGVLSPGHHMLTNPLFLAGGYDKKFIFEFKASDFPFDIIHPDMKKFLYDQARLCYTLETECPSSGSPRYTLEFYLQVSDECTDCILPVSTIQNTVQVDCPESSFPGGAGNFLSVERVNFGYEDVNKNRIADDSVLLTIDQVLEKNTNEDLEDDIRTDIAFQGDRVRFKGSYYLTYGDAFCSYEEGGIPKVDLGPNTSDGPAPFNNFTNSYLVLDIPKGNNFTLLSQAGKDLTVTISYKDGAISKVSRFLIPAGQFNSIATIQSDSVTYFFDFSLSVLSPFHDPSSDAPPLKFESGVNIEFEFYVSVSGNQTSTQPVSELNIIAYPYFSSSVHSLSTINPNEEQLECGTTGFTNKPEIYVPEKAFMCENINCTFNLITISSLFQLAYENGVHYEGKTCSQGVPLHLTGFLGNTFTSFDYFPNEVRPIPGPSHMQVPIPDGYELDGVYFTTPSNANKFGYSFFYQGYYGSWSKSLIPTISAHQYLTDPSNWFSPPYTTSDGFTVYDLKLKRGTPWVDGGTLIDIYQIMANNQLVTPQDEYPESDESYLFSFPYTLKPTCEGTVTKPFKPLSPADQLRVFMDHNTLDYNTQIQTSELKLQGEHFPFMPPDVVQRPLFLKNPDNGTNQMLVVDKKYRVDAIVSMDAIFHHIDSAEFPTGWQYTYLTVEPNPELDGLPVLLNPGTGIEYPYYLIEDRKIYRMGELGYHGTHPMFGLYFRMSGSPGVGSILGCPPNGSVPVTIKFLASCSEDPISLDAAAWCYQQDMSLNLITNISDWTDELTTSNPSCDKQQINHIVRSSGSSAIDSIQYKITLAQNLEFNQDTSSIRIKYGASIVPAYSSSTPSVPGYRIQKNNDEYIITIDNGVLDPPFISDAVGAIPHVNTLTLQYEVLAKPCSYSNTLDGIQIELSGLDICSNLDFKKLSRIITPTIELCIPFAEAGDDDSICVGNSSVVLNGHSPAGGTWSGTGVSSDGIFNPSTAGVHTLTYSFELSGCTLSDTKTLTVHALPVVDFVLPIEYCFGSTYQLTGTPAGGIFDGTGISLNNTQYEFLSNVATPHSIRYVYVDTVTGCADTVIKTITPNPCCPYELRPVEVSCGTDEIHCVTINAVRPVSSGVKAMNFTLRYNSTELIPVINSDNKVTAIYGNVILNTGISSSMVMHTSDIVVADATHNDLFVHVEYNNTAPLNASWNGTGEVMCVNFHIDGAIAASLDNIQIIAFEEEYVSTTKSRCLENVGNASVSVVQNSKLNGILRFHNTSKTLNNSVATPLIYASDNMCADQPDSSWTDNTGHFSVRMGGVTRLRFEQDEQGDYHNSCDETDAVSLMSCINGYDCYLLESVSTKRNPATSCMLFSDRGVPDAYNENYSQNKRGELFPSPYQMIAGDVDLNGRVRGNDVNLLQQRSVAQICEFPQEWNYVNHNPPSSPGLKSYDWRFTNSSGTRSVNYPEAGAVSQDRYTGYWRDAVPVTESCVHFVPQGSSACNAYPQEQEVYAVLLGDLDGSWRNIGSIPSSKGRVVIDYANIISTGSYQYRIPVWYDSEETMVSVDFALNYDESKIHIVNVEMISDNSVRMRYHDFNESQLLLSSYTMGAFNSETNLYYIDVESLGGAIQASDLGSGYGFLNGEKVALVVGTELSPTTTTTFGTWAELFELVPNPTNGEGKIQYSLTGSAAKLVIYNSLGQTVSTYENLNGSGSIELQPLQLANGMYHAVIYHGGNQEVRKIVVSR